MTKKDKGQTVEEEIQDALAETKGDLLEKQVDELVDVLATRPPVGNADGPSAKVDSQVRVESRLRQNTPSSQDDSRSNVPPVRMLTKGDKLYKEMFDYQHYLVPSERMDQRELLALPYLKAERIRDDLKVNKEKVEKERDTKFQERIDTAIAKASAPLIEAFDQQFQNLRDEFDNKATELREECTPRRWSATSWLFASLGVCLAVGLVLMAGYFATLAVKYYASANWSQTPAASSGTSASEETEKEDEWLQQALERYEQPSNKKGS